MCGSSSGAEAMRARFTETVVLKARANLRPHQFSVRQLSLVLTGACVYFALANALNAPFSASCGFALWLGLRYPCVAFAHRPSVSLPALLAGLTLPVLCNLPAIKFQWNSPVSRWSEGDWVSLPVFYCALPVTVFVSDLLSRPYWSRTAQWVRALVEITLILPAWMFVILVCLVRVGRIP